MLLLPALARQRQTFQDSQSYKGEPCLKTTDNALRFARCKCTQFSDNPARQFCEPGFTDEYRLTESAVKWNTKCLTKLPVQLASTILTTLMYTITKLSILD